MEIWKISKTGTTYRFLQRWSRNGVPANTSFCEYYSMLAFNILKVFCYAMSIPGLFVMALIFTGQIKAQAYTTEFWFYITLSLFGIVALCFILAGILVAIMYGIFWTVSNIIIPVGSWIVVFVDFHILKFLFRINKLEFKNKIESKPSFIRTWLQSKKEKFCPIVEFTEE